MPIGLVSDEELEKELSNISGKKGPIQSVPEIIDIPSPGRKNGDVNVPDSLRKIIGETAVIDGRQEAIKLAAEFGISPSSVSAYTKGATSTASYETPTKSILSHINKSRQRAIKRASNTLNGALGAITQEKLDYTDAKDLSIIAKNMSAVIKDLEPSDTGINSDKENKGPQFVIFAPTFKDERSFDVITVNE